MVSRAMPSMMGRHPVSRTAAANASELLLMILPGASASPGSTSSSPVERIATRTRRCTGMNNLPKDASMLISDGLRTVPAESIVSPSLTSSPLKRIWSPGFTFPFRKTVSSRSSACSKGTTASAPAGMGAPVRIFTAVPACMGWLMNPPAGRNPESFRDAASPQSFECTA